MSRRPVAHHIYVESMLSNTVAASAKSNFLHPLSLYAAILEKGRGCANVVELTLHRFLGYDVLIFCFKIRRILLFSARVILAKNSLQRVQLKPSFKKKTNVPSSMHSPHSRSDFSSLERVRKIWTNRFSTSWYSPMAARTYSFSLKAYLLCFPPTISFVS